MTQAEEENTIARCDRSAQAYVTLPDAALVEQCDMDHFRASGPGGQKRNKTSSGVRLRHRPTGLTGMAVDNRSQHVNRVRAVRRLRETIALTLRSRINPQDYEPGPVLAEYVTRDGRISVSRRNAAYFSVVAEILDVLASCSMRVSEAASCMGISTAHLVHFLEKDPKIWAQVNRMRDANGVRPLRRSGSRAGFPKK